MVFDAHNRAFAFFGGVPQRVLALSIPHRSSVSMIYDLKLKRKESGSTPKQGFEPITKILPPPPKTIMNWMRRKKALQNPPPAYMIAELLHIYPVQVNSGKR